MARFVQIALVALFFLCFTAFAAENPNRIVAGSFGIAYLDGNQAIRLCDGKRLTNPLPGIKAHTLLAADLLEEGSDQVIYLDAKHKALHLYSPKTRKSYGPFGSNVQTMAVGRCSADETFPSLFACTYDGKSYRWTKEIMEKGWITVPGAFTQVSQGNFDNTNNLDEFAVVSEGNVYVYSPKWQTYSKVIEGKKIVSVLSGNFAALPGDEIAMIDKDGAVFLYHNKTLEDVGQTATRLVAGHNKEGLDTLYALDKEGVIVRYDQSAKTWAVAWKRMSKFHDFTVTEQGELYAIRNDTLHKRDIRGEWVFPDASTGILWKDGKVAARYEWSLPKTYISELLTPSGKNVLRVSPSDHIHHRGLMYAMWVGGYNFWEETEAKSGEQTSQGSRYFGEKVESEVNWDSWSVSDTRRLRRAIRHFATEPLEMHMIIPDLERTLIREARKITLDQQASDVTLLDWESTFTAVEDTVLGKAGAGHYHGLGMRFVEEMDKGGRFFNSTGKHDGEIVRGDERLTPCRWIAYTATLEGAPVTVALLDHPSNPVPMISFTMGDANKSFAYMSATMNLYRKPIPLKANKTLAVKYRVAVWDGEVTPETIEKAYQSFVE